MILLSVGFGAHDLAACATTVRDNVINFLPDNRYINLQKVFFYPTLNASGQDTIFITNGQPYTGILHPSNLSLNIRAGRKKSTAVAKLLSKWLTGDENKNIVLYTSTAYPHKKLNFAVIGNLVLQFNHTSVELDNMFLAQDGGQPANEWMLGGKNCVRQNIMYSRKHITLVCAVKNNPSIKHIYFVQSRYGKNLLWVGYTFD